MSVMKYIYQIRPVGMSSLGKRYSTVNVVSNADLPFKNCLTDRLIQFSMIFAILFAKRLQF